MPPQNSPIGHQQTPAERQQQRMLIENKLRIKKGNILDKGKMVSEIDRELRSLAEELHHIEQEEHRYGEEIRKMTLEVKQDQAASRAAAMNLRDTSQSLTHKEDEVRRLDREIEQLKHEITEKEQRIKEIKEESRHLARDKEEFRRSGELGHFSMQSEQGHLHDAQVKLQLLTQNRLRKENEQKHKEDTKRTIHRDIMFLEQEVAQLEVEHNRLMH